MNNNYATRRRKLYDEYPELASTAENIDKLKLLFTKPYVLANYINDLWQKRNDTKV